MTKTLLMLRGDKAVVSRKPIFLLLIQTLFLTALAQLPTSGSTGGGLDDAVRDQSSVGLTADGLKEEA